MKLRKIFISSLLIVLTVLSVCSFPASAVNRTAIGYKYYNSSDYIKITLETNPADNEVATQNIVFINGVGYPAAGSAASFKKDRLASGREYKISLMTTYFNIKSGKKRTSLSEEVSYATKPLKTAITKRSTTYNSITLTWSAVKNCDGYKIYNVLDDGSLKTIKTIKGKNNTSCTVTGLKSSTKYKYAVKALKYFENGTRYTVSEPVYTTNTTKPHPEISTSKTKLGIIRLNSDTVSKPDASGNKVTLRKGIYTGYKKDDFTYVLAVGYGGKYMPYDNKSIDVLYAADSTNSILSSGSISMHAQGKDYSMGCGPTAACILINHELKIPNGDSTVSKNTIFDKYRYDSRVEKFSYGSNFGVTDGVPNKTCVAVIVDDYAKQYGKRAYYYDTGAVTGSQTERENKIIDMIDKELAAGHRVLPLIAHNSYNENGLTKHNYLGTSTHYVVLTGETSGRGGNYYIAEPDHWEARPYSTNGSKYYYGLNERTKREIARSIIKTESNAGVYAPKLRGYIVIK